MNIGIGHNSGRVVEPGQSWRKHVWTRARKDLLPTLPIEVVRRRVARAKELGLPYRTYAGIRASNGHDLIGFLFSSNALRVFKSLDEMPHVYRSHLSNLINCQRLAAFQKPLRIELTDEIFDRVFRAPDLTMSWGETGDHIKRHLTGPSDRFVLVAETTLEAEWSAAARMAGVLAGENVFSADVSANVAS